MLKYDNEIIELHKQLTIQAEKELELDNVLALITKHCLTTQGKKLISNGKFVNISDLNNELSQVQEMFDMLTTDEPLPLARIEDVKELIRKAKIDGAVLEIRELKYIASMIQVAREIKSFTKSRKTKYPLTCQEINTIYDDRVLVKKLDATIDENENIRDNATPELHKIRSELRDKNSKLHSRMTKLVREYADADLISDDFYTIKEGRFVLSIKASHKRKLPGIVHGVSQTGATVYLEPNMAVELNNELSLLHSAEKREIYIILQSLTRIVAESSTDLLSLYNTLSHIDSIFAKAQYATDNGGVKPIISNSKILELKKAYHPLLVHKLGIKNVVPLSISFNESQRGHLISGPNAGGKTIAMKTLGLSIMLAQRGIFPLGEIHFSPLNVYTSIGDGQSVEQNLSTFSFQLTRLKQILDVSTYFSGYQHEVNKFSDFSSTDNKLFVTDCLLLIDEICSGTDPREGSALACGILDTFIELCLFFVVTTHQSSLKVYAMNTRTSTTNKTANENEQKNKYDSKLSELEKRLSKIKKNNAIDEKTITRLRALITMLRGGYFLDTPKK